MNSARPRSCADLQSAWDDKRHWDGMFRPALQRRRRAIFGENHAANIPSSVRSGIVRLRRQKDGAVGVRFRAVRNRAVSSRNCVAAMRGAGNLLNSFASQTAQDNLRSLDLLFRFGSTFGQAFQLLPVFRTTSKGGCISSHEWHYTEMKNRASVVMEGTVSRTAPVPPLFRSLEQIGRAAAIPAAACRPPCEEGQDPDFRNRQPE